jgi:hypothetical protein
MSRALSQISALTDLLPIDSAMPELTPKRRQSPEILAAAESVVRELKDPALQAGIWLYVDDLDRSHRISQDLHSREGSLWHALMHRREGDFWNSKYWLRQAGDVSVLAAVIGDPSKFVDRVEQANGTDPEDLLALQRKEWLALFEHCAMLANEVSK